MAEGIRRKGTKERAEVMGVLEKHIDSLNS